MSKNKNAILRFRVLDKCFRNPGKKYFIEDLIKICSETLFEESELSNGISKRQIFEDIKFMESPNGWNVPLARIRDGHRVYYRYSDLSFSINNQPLNESEETQLKEALLTLSRFKGMPQFEWIDEIATRLDSSLGLTHKSQKVIDFEQNTYLSGIEYISPIYHSIVYSRVINIEYKSFKKNEIQNFILHPYFLKQYNNRWYVFGRNDKSENVMNLALDRIHSIKEIKKKYTQNTTIDFSSYFDDIVGVSLNTSEKLLLIILNVSNKLLPYIKTKPIHGSQKIKKEGITHTQVTLEIIPNYEFETIILSYGEGVEVLKPKAMREKIKKRVSDLSKIYLNNAG